MILSDREFRAELDRGAIVIDPRPEATSDLWSSTALDLRLGPKLQLWKPMGGAGVESVVKPSRPDFNVTEIGKAYGEEQDCTEGWHFAPKQFVLGWTQERIKLPHRSRLAARVEGKSSLARLGVGVHITAPTIHAGFGFRASDLGYGGSELQLEIWNAGPLTVELKAGMPVCQLIVEEVHGTPDKAYTGQFAVQGSAAGGNG